MIKRFTHHWVAHRDRVRRLSKEGGWIVGGQIASVLGALALVRVLTEYLEPSEYGELALGLTIAGLINQVVMGGVSAGIGRFYSIAAEKGDLWGYLRASRWFLGYATLVVMAIAIALIIGLLATGHGNLLGLAVAVLVFSILSGYNSALNGVQNAARQRAVVALHGGMDAWLKIGLVVGVILWLGSGSTTVVIGYALSAMVVTASQLYFLRRLMVRQGVSQGGKSQEEWVRKMWQFSWPFSAFGVFTWTQQVSDRWALEGFVSTHEVGQYAVVFQLGYAPIVMLTGLLTTLIGPILYQRSGAVTDHARNVSVHRIAWRITQVSLAVTAVAFFVTWFLHGWLFQWLVAEAFRGVSHFLPWVVVAGGLFAVGQMLSLKLMSEMRSRSLLQVKIGTAVLGVCVNLLGAWLYGTAGVVAGLVIFACVYFLWMIYLAWHLPDR
jgi:O-antigen/teichoic acid export membrane protein